MDPCTVAGVPGWLCSRCGTLGGPAAKLAELVNAADHAPWRCVAYRAREGTWYWQAVVEWYRDWIDRRRAK